MTEPADRTFRRILLAQGLGGGHPAALELALQLAARHQAELANLIIEELELLQAATLPTATEVLRHSGEHRPLRAESLAGRAQAQAQELRRELQRRGAVRWSIEILSGAFPGTPAARLRRGELLVLGRAPRSPWPADAGTGPVLLVYAEAQDRAGLEALASEVLDHQHTPGPPRRALEIVPRPDPALLLAALRRHRPGLILAATSPALLDRQTLRQLLEEADCPIVLLA